jgi:hypothetical protein
VISMTMTAQEYRANARQDPWRQKLIAAVFDDSEPFARKPSG